MTCDSGSRSESRDAFAARAVGRQSGADFGNRPNVLPFKTFSHDPSTRGFHVIYRMGPEGRATASRQPCHSAEPEPVKNGLGPSGECQAQGAGL